MRSGGGDTLAAVDDYGRLRLARFPWLRDDNPTHDLRGPSTALSKVAFTTGDSYVLTAGSRDRCVLVCARA